MVDQMIKNGMQLMRANNVRAQTLDFFYKRFFCEVYGV
jgi:hypothetical protein